MVLQTAEWMIRKKRWGITSNTNLFQSNVGNGLRPRPLLPPKISARTLLFGFIQFIQLKLDNVALNTYPGPILQFRGEKIEGPYIVHTKMNPNTVNR